MRARLRRLRPIVSDTGLVTTKTFLEAPGNLHQQGQIRQGTRLFGLIWPTIRHLRVRHPFLRQTNCLPIRFYESV